MVQTVAITKAITSLSKAHEKFNLSRIDDLSFFTEWFEELPGLTEQEKASLHRYRDRYFYYAEDGAITEGTIHLIMVSPLLELIELYDPPFKIRGEKPVKVELEDEDTILQGVIDALVVQHQFWVVVIEAKQYGFNVTLAIPQALAYMMGNVNLEQPVFGMVTNGEDYLFIKLNQQTRQYALSRKFTLSNPQRNELYDVMQVMKRITGSFVQA